MHLLLLMNGIIDFIVWAPPSCEKREPSEKFKMKIITILAVVKTLTVLWNRNTINTCDNACMQLIMFWFVHVKFCNQ